VQFQALKLRVELPARPDSESRPLILFSCVHHALMAHAPEVKTILWGLVVFAPTYYTGIPPISHVSSYYSLPTAPPLFSCLSLSRYNTLRLAHALRALKDASHPWCTSPCTVQLYSMRLRPTKANATAITPLRARLFHCLATLFLSWVTCHLTSGFNYIAWNW